jgi:hypothetical protein
MPRATGCPLGYNDLLCELPMINLVIITFFVNFNLLLGKFLMSMLMVNYLLKLTLVFMFF